jgi:hypothetical protein
MVSNDPVWFSPIRAYSEYLKLAEKVGVEAIENDAQYKRVLETKALAILCFAMFVANKTPWFLQLHRDDPPDGLIMRISPDKPGNHEVLGVEVTSYFRNKTGLPKDSLLEQLKKTKMFKDYHKYSDHDVILVDLGWGYEPDFNEIHEYMADIGAPYQLWFLQEVQSQPDTIAEMTLCNTLEARQRKVNIGKAWHDMKAQKVFGAIHTIRVGNIDKVGAKQGEPIIGAPWELMA